MIWIFVGLVAFAVLFVLGVRQFATNSAAARADRRRHAGGDHRGRRAADALRPGQPRLQPDPHRPLAGARARAGRRHLSADGGLPRRAAGHRDAALPARPAAGAGVRGGRPGRRLPAAAGLAAPVPGASPGAVRPADPRAGPGAGQRDQRRTEHHHRLGGGRGRDGRAGQDRDPAAERHRPLRRLAGGGHAAAERPAAGPRGPRADVDAGGQRPLRWLADQGPARHLAHPGRPQGGPARGPDDAGPVPGHRCPGHPDGRRHPAGPERHPAGHGRADDHVAARPDRPGRVLRDVRWRAPHRPADDPDRAVRCSPSRPCGRRSAPPGPC